ncbi:MAG TPA: hypothetical protein DCY79_02900 [Planctomycetaceae bacterium]|nr:hypothetical protein [Blastopirellula sp.]HAY78739.1 hypothetical protein [Planctomycetaceae bacterium]
MLSQPEACDAILQVTRKALASTMTGVLKWWNSRQTGGGYTSGEHGVTAVHRALGDLANNR